MTADRQSLAAHAEEGEFERMADLVQKLGQCETKGDMLSLIVSYRYEVRLAALAALRDAAPAEPLATLHDDGHYTFKRGMEPWGARNAGWRLDVYAAAPCDAAPALPITVERVVELARCAQSIPHELSSVDPISLTPVQLAWVVGMLHKETAAPPAALDAVELIVGEPDSTVLTVTTTAGELRRMRAALSAAPAQPPAGWKLVPVEPTPEMMNAVIQPEDCEVYGLHAVNAQLRAEYRAMLDAAPPATPQEPQ